MTFRKIVWLSDTHLTQSGEVEGVPSRARLERAVDQLRRYHSDAIACVVSGDISDTGDPRDYVDAKAILDQLSVPVLPIIGNHDLRAPFRAVFAPPGSAMDDYQQYRMDFDDLMLLCLDTVTPGSDAGGFDNARLSWVEEQLQKSTGQRVIVFMHHPPGPLWLGHQDRILLQDAEPLLGLFNAAKSVAYIFFGHVHRPVSGVLGRVPFTTLRAVAHQTLPAHHLKSWDDFTAPNERPQYGVIHVADDRIVTHANDIEDTA